MTVILEDNQKKLFSDENFDHKIKTYQVYTWHIYVSSVFEYNQTSSGDQFDFSVLNSLWKTLSNFILFQHRQRKVYPILFILIIPAH